MLLKDYNDLALNVNKCKHMSYHLKRRPFICKLTFLGNPISFVSEIRDLIIYYLLSSYRKLNIQIIIYSRFCQTYLFQL